ncbi:hypothetical protein F5Y02DRAFT_416339 [Annulohypoxylon stygium]|nr:hypothetical protein F5Y02DRAFT_416339 [Annulohypoxylon stygium]
MASPRKEKKKSESPQRIPRDDEGDTLMSDASPRVRNNTQGARPMRSPMTRIALRRSIQAQSEHIETPRRSRADSTSSTDSLPLIPTPGMVPRSRLSASNSRIQQQAEQRTPSRPAQPVAAGTDAAGSTSTPGLPALPHSMTPRVTLSSSVASSSSFRSSVLAGELPMPETPAQAKIGTPKEVPERRRSNRFIPRESLSAITPTNPTHRRASALFQSQSAAAREAEEKAMLSEAFQQARASMQSFKSLKELKKKQMESKDKKEDGEKGDDDDEEEEEENKKD